MSDGIQLSDELISDLLQVIIRFDQAVEEDLTLGLQYLAAVTGFLSAAYPGPDSERHELLEHLAAFTKHVSDDRADAAHASGSQAQPEPKGHSVATDDPAVGIWKPT